MPEVRIQKALADAGVASRRAADELVAEGRVSVDGRPARIGERVDIAAQRILVDGRPIAGEVRPMHLALDKPAGVTSTVADRHAERTVIDLVPREMRIEAGRLYPVGRLDRDTEGLLLLTNDGPWAQRLIHPRYEVEREYAIGLRYALRPEQGRELAAGIGLEEGMARVARLRGATGDEVATMTLAVDESPRGLYWYRATLRQGWRRQLRRMFAAVEAPVERLVRVRIGSLLLDGMRPGELRRLSAAEVASLDEIARAQAAAAATGGSTRR